MTVHTGSGEKDPAFAIVSGRLAVSNSVKNLERLIDRAVTSGSDAGSRQRESVPRRSAAMEIATRSSRSRHVSFRVSRISIACVNSTRSGSCRRISLIPGAIFLFGSWLDAIKKAPSLAASVRWSTTELAASLELPVPKGGRPATLKGFVPGPAKGTAPLIQPPGTIASLSLWRDWATIWESRADLFSPEVVQGFAQLDTIAGQFFGAQEFGPDVLGRIRAALAAGGRPPGRRVAQAQARRQAAGDRRDRRFE